jgi:hypothetical protein
MATEVQHEQQPATGNGHVPPATPEVPTPKGRSFKRRALAVGAGVAGLLVGVGIGAAGGGQTKTVVRVPPAQTVTQTVASVRTRVKKVPVVRTRTVTQTVTAPAQTVTAPASAAPASAPAGGTGGPNTFTGTGSESLGTITVPNDATLHWTCSSCTTTGMLIASDINGDGNSIQVYQTATQGQSAVSAGTYKNVSVNADGDFTITIN